MRAVRVIIRRRRARDVDAILSRVTTPPLERARLLTSVNSITRERKELSLSLSLIVKRCTIRVAIFFHIGKQAPFLRVSSTRERASARECNSRAI